MSKTLYAVCYMSGSDEHALYKVFGDKHVAESNAEYIRGQTIKVWDSSLNDTYNVGSYDVTVMEAWVEEVEYVGLPTPGRID